MLHAGEGNEILRPLLGARSVLLLDGPEHMAERKALLPPFHGERMQAYGELIRDDRRGRGRDVADRTSRSRPARACRR